MSCGLQRPRNETEPQETAEIKHLEKPNEAKWSQQEPEDSMHHGQNNVSRKENEQNPNPLAK